MPFSAFKVKEKERRKLKKNNTVNLFDMSAGFKKNLFLSENLSICG
jgi:hypothetical protein